MRAASVVFYREAQEDANSIAHYIAKDNLAAATRFLDELDDLCEMLIKTPNIGSKRVFKNSQFEDMRVLPLKKFPNYLVFYRLQESTIEIVRVIHGARDLPRLFGR